MDAFCIAQENSCLDSFTTTSNATSATPVDCVSKYTACEANGGDDNTCEADNAQCKVSAIIDKTIGRVKLILHRTLAACRMTTVLAAEVQMMLPV